MPPLPKLQFPNPQTLDTKPPILNPNPQTPLTMGWLRLVGSLKLQVSVAKELYKRDDILQKKPMILRSLLIVAIPYEHMPPLPKLQFPNPEHPTPSPPYSILSPQPQNPRTRFSTACFVFLSSCVAFAPCVVSRGRGVIRLILLYLRGVIHL